MKFDYQKLRGEIVKQYGSLDKFSTEVLHMTKTNFSRILNSKTFFSQKAIRNICSVLGIKAEEIGTYFFTLKVE